MTGPSSGVTGRPRARLEKPAQECPAIGHAALRALISDRLTLAPQNDRESPYYGIDGAGTIAPLLSGFVQVLASPPGFVMLGPVSGRLRGVHSRLA